MISAKTGMLIAGALTVLVVGAVTLGGGVKELPAHQRSVCRFHGKLDAMLSNPNWLAKDGRPMAEFLERLARKDPRASQVLGVDPAQLKNEIDLLLLEDWGEKT
jgi:hypothetical protein